MQFQQANNYKLSMQAQMYWYLPVPFPNQQAIAAPSYYLTQQIPLNYSSPSHIPPLLSYQQHYPLQQLPTDPQSNQQRRRFKRRTEVELNKCHKCPYPNCHKGYASDLALNLHMKTKHRGGNKKQRDRVAKLILKHEMEGKPLPKCNVNLPPGYIEANKIRLLLLETQDEGEVTEKSEEQE